MEEYTFGDRVLAIFLLVPTAGIVLMFVLMIIPTVLLDLLTEMIYCYILHTLNVPDLRRKNVIESVVVFYFVLWFTWKVIVSLIFYMCAGRIDDSSLKEDEREEKEEGDKKRRRKR